LQPGKTGGSSRRRRRRKPKTRQANKPA